MLFDISCKQRCDFDIKFLIKLTSYNQDLGRISIATIEDNTQKLTCLSRRYSMLIEAPGFNIL